MLQATLYQRILGDGFSQLPAALHQFHSQAEGGRARGTVTVKRGRGLLRCGLATLLHLPPPGHQLPLQLQVAIEEDREHWIRRFDDYCLDTLQWQEGDLLIEKAGILQFAFRLSVENSTLIFQQQFCRLAAVRLPRFMALSIGATARAQSHGWQVEVAIHAPLLGMITTYEGEVELS